MVKVHLKLLFINYLELPPIVYILAKLLVQLMEEMKKCIFSVINHAIIISYAMITWYIIHVWYLIMYDTSLYVDSCHWACFTGMYQNFLSNMYLLIFKDLILVLDFSSRYQKKNSQMHFWDDSETRR